MTQIHSNPYKTWPPYFFENYANSGERFNRGYANVDDNNAKIFLYDYFAD